MGYEYEKKEKEEENRALSVVFFGSSCATVEKDALFLTSSSAARRKKEGATHLIMENSSSGPVSGRKKNGKSFLRLSGLLFPGLPSSAIPLIRQVAKGHAHPRARTVSHRRHQSTSTGRRAALCDRYGYTTTDGGRLIDSVFFAPVKISSSLQRARSIGAKEGKIKNRQLRRP